MAVNVCNCRIVHLVILTNSCSFKLEEHMVHTVLTVTGSLEVEHHGEQANVFSLGQLELSFKHQNLDTIINYTLFAIHLAQCSPVIDFQTFPRNRSHPFCAMFWVSRETKNNEFLLCVFFCCAVVAATVRNAAFLRHFKVCKKII